METSATPTQTTEPMAPTPKAPAKAPKKAKAKTVAPAAVPATPAKKGKKAEGKKAEGFVSLTNGMARPAAFTDSLSKDLAARYPGMEKFLQKLHQDCNITWATVMVSYQPAKGKRVGDWFKLSWRKAGKKGDLPKALAASKQGHGFIGKVDPAFGPLTKFNQPIVILTFERGSKKITLWDSYKLA